MAVDELNLGDIRSLTEALARIPNGREAAELAAALRLWSSDLHRSPVQVESFPRQISQLGPPQLSDLASRVAADAGRVVELVGLLRGLNGRLKMRLKQATARARATARREWSSEAKKPPTAAELNDMAAEDQNVMEIEDQMAVLELVLAAAEAQRDVLFMNRETISREITFRCAQIEARIY